MTKLNFTTALKITKGSDAAIINIPDDSIQLLYTIDEKVYLRKAELTYKKNYPGLSFGAATQLDYEHITNASIKSFPQYGSYGFVTSTDPDDGVARSMIIKDF